MSVCACPGCHRKGTKLCSVCLKEPYCSSGCQKTDWKAHKLFCKILKRLSNQLQSFDQVKQTITEILEKGNIRALEHAVPYLEFQLGDRVPEKAYRERHNGQQISNYGAEIKILIPLYIKIIGIYRIDTSLSQLHQDNIMFPYVEKSLNILKP